MSDTQQLRAVDVWAGYGGNAIIRGISLELTPGMDPVGVIGPSGIGKSTLVQVLRGQLKPTRGQVTYASRTVTKLGRRDQKAFTALVRGVSQDGISITDPRWTVTRALSDTFTAARKAGRASGRSPEDVLTEVDLHPRYLPRTVQSLSGGERQRLALALALLPRPELLILDEPLTAVDPAMRGAIVRNLQQIASAQGIGVLVVSHDLELISRLCPTVHVLAEGQFVASGTLNHILTTTPHPTIRELAEAAPHAMQRFS